MGHYALTGDVILCGLGSELHHLLGNKVLDTNGPVLLNRLNLRVPGRSYEPIDNVPVMGAPQIRAKSAGGRRKVRGADSTVVGRHDVSFGGCGRGSCSRGADEESQSGEVPVVHCDKWNVDPVAPTVREDTAKLKLRVCLFSSL